MYDVLTPHQIQFVEHYKDQLKAAFLEQRHTFNIIYDPSKDYTIILGAHNPKRVSEDTPRKAKLRVNAAIRSNLADLIDNNPEWFQSCCADLIKQASSKGDLRLFEVLPDASEHVLPSQVTIDYT